MIDCGLPEIENSLVLETNLSYTNRIKLRCQPGYTMFPAVAKAPELLCDISGYWYPKSEQFKCKRKLLISIAMLVSTELLDSFLTK